MNEREIQSINEMLQHCEAIELLISQLNDATLRHLMQHAAEAAFKRFGPFLIQIPLDVVDEKMREMAKIGEKLEAILESQGATKQ